MYKRYWTPRTKKDLIKALRPHWAGKLSDLHASCIKRLKAIYKTTMDRKLIELMRKEV
jgi:hypothetical protein